MNAFTHILARLGLLTKDLDYHLIRASMVLIFLAFGYQKWFAYEAEVLIPFISNGLLIFWLYPVFGVRGASWFLGVPNGHSACCCFWGFGTNDGNFGSHRFNTHVHRDGHHHSIRAERLGSGCGISGDGRHCALPDEGCRSFGGFDLLAQTGRRARD
jgi:hypothetical protein